MSGLTIIAATGGNGAIGRNGGLPWSGLRGELAWFRQATLNHPIIMGRKTWESLPKALPGRLNIVISSSLSDAGHRVFSSFSEAVKEFPDAMVIGGAEIYKQAIPIAQTMLITRVHLFPENCDTFFPDYNILEWNVQPGISGENWHVEKLTRKADVVNSVNITE